MEIKNFSLACVLGFTVCISGCSPSVFSTGKGVSGMGQVAPMDNTIVRFDEEEAIEKINTVRAKYGLIPVRFDPRLMKAAQTHANLMGATGRFGHEFGPSTRFKRRIFSSGFQNSAGENIGVGYRSVDEAIEGWLSSPGHRKILLKRHFSVGGIAYARNVSGKNPRLNHFWVLILGSS